MSSAEHNVGIDIDSTLSSLFFLRDGSDPITLPARDPENAPVNKSSTRRLLAVATSIAAICVRRPTSEVFACSLSISRNSLVIYLAENRSVDPVTIAYLDRILSRLVDISEEQGSFAEHVLGTLAVVLEFTLPKFLDAISRRDEDWDARMADIGKLDLSDDERSTFLELQNRICYVYRTAELYASQRSDEILGELATGLGYLRDFIFEGPDKDVVAGALKKFDFPSHSRLDDEAVMAEDLDPGSTSQGFSLTRYVARMLSIIVHVMRLVTLAISPTYKHLFTRARPPTIHHLTPVPKSVLIDTGAALRFLPDDSFSSSEDTIRQIDACSHAEITLFQRLLREGPPGGYWVIGTSKLMCAGCYATIARAYPKVLQDSRSQLGKLKPFLVQGSHGKLYAPWIPPTLSDLDELLGLDFDRRVKATTLDVLKDDLMAIVNSRRSSRATKGKFKLFKTPADRSDFEQRFRERVRKIP